MAAENKQVAIYLLQNLFEIDWPTKLSLFFQSKVTPCIIWFALIAIKKHSKAEAFEVAK